MNIPKQGMLVGLAVATVGATGFVIADKANAQSLGDHQEGLVSRIAKKFNVPETDVKGVFEADMAEKDSSRSADMSARLQVLVDNKTITVEQKALIEAKFAEMKQQREAERDADKNLTQAERSEKHAAAKVALEAWAKENGIDLSELDGLFMHGRGGHGHNDEGGSEKE